MIVPPRYSEKQARAAIAASQSFAEALRQMEMCCSGNADLILRKYAALWGISTAHFAANPGRANVDRRNAPRTPLEVLLVEGRYVKSAALKERLYREGLKERRCELCGQGEAWRGRHMSLILDHVNGKKLDNRLDNLRIVCANCNATLDTHCGRNAALNVTKLCEHCGNSFRPKRKEQRFCSSGCGSRWDRRGRPIPGARRVQRPPLDQLLAEVADLGWSGTGRKYGLSDNAIRKWVRAYEAHVDAA